MEKRKECGCPHCEPELKKGCMNPGFCKPCGAAAGNEKIKICGKCKAEYFAEYDECPSCMSSNKK